MIDYGRFLLKAPSTEAPGIPLAQDGFEKERHHSNAKLAGSPGPAWVIPSHRRKFSSLSMWGLRFKSLCFLKDHHLYGTVTLWTPYTIRAHCYCEIAWAFQWEGSRFNATDVWELPVWLGLWLLTSPFSCLKEKVKGTSQTPALSPLSVSMERHSIKRLHWSLQNMGCCHQKTQGDLKGQNHQCAHQTMDT